MKFGGTVKDGLKGIVGLDDLSPSHMAFKKKAVSFAV